MGKVIQIVGCEKLSKVKLLDDDMVADIRGNASILVLEGE